MNAQITPESEVAEWVRLKGLLPSRFLLHENFIDVCLASWPTDPETIYALTLTPPVLPQPERRTP